MIEKALLIGTKMADISQEKILCTASMERVK
jgi:hypothetical protein